jgi:hypothetical protein
VGRKCFHDLLLSWKLLFRKKKASACLLAKLCDMTNDVGENFLLVLLSNDVEERRREGRLVGRIFLDEPLPLLGDVMAGGSVDDSLVGVHRIIRSLILLRQILAFVSRLVTVDENGHDNQQQQDDEQ